MKVMLLSAYHAQSHDYWAEGLQRTFPDFEWTVLSLPPRHFSWRIRGNSLSWAFAHSGTLKRHYDLIIATSMCDLSSLRGFVPEMARVPTLVYCHENQFAYPFNPQQQGQVEAQVLSLYTALCADQLVFNSEYNRRSFLDGVRSLLKKMPDFVPLQAVEARLSASVVIPVGIDLSVDFPNRVRSQRERLRVVWNHRWEYDKGPSRLLALIKRCDANNLPLDFSIIGQQFRRQPSEFETLRTCIEHSQTLRLRHWGYIDDRAQYSAILQEADVVLSTALHDFQGLSVLEAVAAGSVPLVPKELAYPEWFSEPFLYNDDEACLARLGDWLQLQRQGRLPAPPDISRLSWSALAHTYLDIFEATRRQAIELR